jgi:hypothetical protein
MPTIFQSCFKDHCDVDGPGYSYLNSLSVDLKQITGKEKTEYGEFLSIEPADSSQAIRFDSVILDVKNDFTAMLEEKNIPLFGINSAFACSIVIHYEKIQEFIITSDKDYDQKHPAGTNLADIILIRQGNTIEGMTYAHFQLHKPSLLSNSSGLYFSFASPPLQTSSHKIEIKYILTNGKELITNPVNVIIKK